MDKPFEEAYFTHMLWMFFRETKEAEEDIRRMFHQKALTTLVRYATHVLQSTFYLRNLGGFISKLEVQIVCHCDLEAEVESEIEASIDIQPEASIDEKSEATIDEELEAPIESDHANEIDDFPEGSINSWENDYYQPRFAIQTATPSNRKISAMEPDGYGEDNIEEDIIEYGGLAIEEA
ncbi:hypothetical protein DY000_02059897 [Brassica cretica]|uniref:DUF1985 domain-containing protein n=1 Tax=Brassica cretica TaxID=69181 RepID=A0ABQ7APL0_BRACR|nr:hypothetical protein DY000_02059897 [Brassica cretica]